MNEKNTKLVIESTKKGLEQLERMMQLLSFDGNSFFLFCFAYTNIHNSLRILQGEDLQPAK